MTFLVAFLGSLTAVVVAVALVYTWFRHWMWPSILKQGGGEVFSSSVREGAAIGSRMVQESRADIASDRDACPMCLRSFALIHTCADHGRCSGCPRVLSDFHAYVIACGATVDEADLAELARLRAVVASQEASS
jgi:hypothetical protein